MKILWFISILFLVLTSCNNFICRKVQTEITVNHRAMPLFSDTVNVRKFKGGISFKKTEMSGILIYKKLNDSTSAGSFINEFGLKGFDFLVNDRKAKLVYVFRKLNRWYIRRTLETDLHFIFAYPKLLTSCSINDTIALVAGISRSVHYVYYNSEDKPGGRADMYKRARKISSLHQYNNELKGLVIKMEHKDRPLSYEFSEIKN